MKTRTIGIVIIVAVVAVAAVLVIMSRNSSETASAAGYEGQVIAPADFAVADYAGKPLALNFFFRNCPACGAEAADLAKFASSNPGARVIAVDVQDGESDAIAFMQEHGLQIPLVVDDGSLGSRYAIQYTPTTILFDANGKEVDRLVGASTLDQFNAALAKAQ